jgi:hypothetical protein
MPKEQVINDPLAAEEIKAIIVAKIEEALAKNSPLVDDLTYAGFRVKFDIQIGFINSVTPGTLVWGVHSQGEQQGEVVEQPVSGEYQSDPSPNKTREDNDLPLPVMVQTPSGPQKRRVRIQNAKAKRN